MSHTHADVHFVDSNASTPVDFADGTALDIPLLTEAPAGLPLAEFGLAVDAGDIGNFVKIDGTVGVRSIIGTGPTILQNVTIRVYRRDTLAAEPFPGTLVFSTTQSLVGALNRSTISFNFVDGGNGTAGQPQVPPSYYAYTMTIFRDEAIDTTSGLPVGGVLTPIVTGPIQLTGESSTTHVEEPDHHEHLT